MAEVTNDNHDPTPLENKPPLTQSIPQVGNQKLPEGADIGPDNDCRLFSVRQLLPEGLRYA